MSHTSHTSGHLEVIVGPMFSGKSEELIRRVNRALIAKQEVIVFKPAVDDRYHSTSVTSHGGRSLTAHALQNSSQILSLLETVPFPNVVAIDEVQFFDPHIIRVAVGLADKGCRVMLAGLDLDFRGEPFSVVPELLARAEVVDKLTAICINCGAPATRTQRLIEGKPARYNDPIVMVGAAETYEARCRACHIISPPYSEDRPKTLWTGVGKT